MNTYKNILLLLPGILLLFFSGCTTSKFGTGSDSDVTTHKVKDLDEIEETSYANKMKAHYNQIYYYPFDSSWLSEEDLRSIQVQAEYLKDHPGSKVVINGHTDSRGSSEYNVGLGERRALSVVEELKKYGVSTSQIKFNSFGAEKPAVLGETEAAFKWNRRTELAYKDF